MSDIKVTLGDMLEVLAARKGPLFDAVVTDPPYHLASIVKRFGGKNAAMAKEGATGAYARASRGFMGQTWDGGDIAFRHETWRAVYDQMKPGAHLVAFSGTRTYHRMAVAIEDAGFEIRDMLAWTYGSGFPKSHDVAKGIDKRNGHWRGRRGQVIIESQVAKGTEYERTDKGDPITDDAQKWTGWGSALKPALEPICLARKPLDGTIAENVLKWGTGGLNIDACRVGWPDDVAPKIGTPEWGGPAKKLTAMPGQDGENVERAAPSNLGRFPANLLHDGSVEVTATFPYTKSGEFLPHHQAKGKSQIGTFDIRDRTGEVHPTYGDEGSAARFFFSAKAGPLDRLGSEHATVKPVDLMRWLCRLVTPKGGLILEPFGGSGTTAIAAMAEGFNCELIKLMPDHVTDIETKIAYLRGEGGRIMERHLKRKAKRAKPSEDGLFGEGA